METKIRGKVLNEASRYTYRVTWSDEDQEYVGLCAEFPSLSWLANTPEAALRGILDIVADTVLDMQSNNESIPEPLAMRRYSGIFTVRTLPDVHKRLAIQAAEAKVSINRLICSKLE
jgi:predicted HicB family RNase H-like nuclease